MRGTPPLHTKTDISRNFSSTKSKKIRVVEPLHYWQTIFQLRSDDSKMKFEVLEENNPHAHKRCLRLLEKWKQGNDAIALQRVFIYNHVAEFFNLLEKRYLQKILEDIDYILTKGWALEISEDDFYHRHICGKSKTVIRDLHGLLAASNVCFLYHTLEHKQHYPEAINRNILSFPNTQPIVVHPKYEFLTRPYYTVDSSRLGLMEYARIFFSKDQEKPCKLKDGTKLTILGKYP